MENREMGGRERRGQRETQGEKEKAKLERWEEKEE
jgi:hypothetical protein